MAVQGYAIRMMMLQLAVNHTVLIETICDANDNVIGTALSASSPDEVCACLSCIVVLRRRSLWYCVVDVAPCVCVQEAFVCAATYFGYEFKGRNKDIVTVNVHGVDQQFKVCPGL